MAIKVLRLIEYEYDTAEKMIKDMANWTLSIPASKVRAVGMSMKSAVLTPEWLTDDEKADD